MIKVEKVDADYFDYCDHCGEVIDRTYMYSFSIGCEEFKLCYTCSEQLRRKLNREMED